ncbi:spore-associated protein A [Streptomyces triticagri]|uniref:Spore-associated protein A n=1 Tax=Streptomyces triticagri TaxID=2293568 RepID=A0A372M9J8_9ACTN|nr:spore-associated protein A [Streptomyces triticagri]RFU87604.1 spore-associated protein A [Streptomyces triticagri]
MKTLGASLLTAGVVGAGLVATAPAAGAAEAAAEYNGACGSGFSVVNSLPVGTDGAAGTVFLTYNSSTGENCTVTVRSSAGEATHMVAYVRNVDTDEDSYEEGDFTQYAGPVYVEARGACVEWGGVIGKEQAWNFGSNCGSLTGKASQKDWFAGRH